MLANISKPLQVPASPPPHQPEAAGSKYDADQAPPLSGAFERLFNFFGLISPKAPLPHEAG